MNEKVVIEMTFDEYEEYKKQKKIDDYSFMELIGKAILKNGVKHDYFNISNDPLSNPNYATYLYENKDEIVCISIKKKV